MAPRSDLERLKRQAVAAIWIGKTVGYSLAQHSTLGGMTVMLRLRLRLSTATNWVSFRETWVS